MLRVSAWLQVAQNQRDFMQFPGKREPTDSPETAHAGASGWCFCVVISLKIRHLGEPHRYLSPQLLRVPLQLTSNPANHLRNP